MQSRVVVFFLIVALVFVGGPTHAEQSPASKNTPGQVNFGEYARVGINTKTPATTLDVYQGEIRIGSSGAACTKDLMGALRAADNKLQFCDGAGWRNVSFDKAQ
jgi:hypothetical protein